MGRLIEAETLKASVRAKFPNVADRCEINELINAAPTVDAIPVGWLEAKRERMANAGHDTPDQAIAYVLWLWRKEAKSDG